MVSAATTTSASSLSTTIVSTSTPTAFAKMSLRHQTPLERRSFFGGMICCLFLLAPLFLYVVPRVTARVIGRCLASLRRARANFRREQVFHRRQIDAWDEIRADNIRELRFEQERLRLVADGQNEEWVAIWWKNMQLNNIAMQNIQDRQNIQDETMRLHAAKVEFAEEKRAFERQQARAQVYNDAMMRQLAAESAEVERARAEALVVANQSRERTRVELLAYIHTVVAGESALRDFRERVQSENRETIRQAREEQGQAMLRTAELVRIQREMRRESMELDGDYHLYVTWLARTILFE